MKDLGVYLTDKLNFSVHVNKSVTKAFKLLGFVKRNCKDFKNVNAIKSIYIALVRTSIEYANVIWNPYQKTLIKRIESVQRRFIKFLSFKASVCYEQNDYLTLCKHFNLPTLESKPN